MSWLDRVRAAEKKAVTANFWTQDDVRFGRYLPRTSYNYGRDIGEGLRSNVIMAPVNWIMRTFAEAKPIVEVKRKRRWVEIEDHSLTEKLHRPNGFVTGDSLWKATIISYVLDGNAYWHKMRNAFGEVVELWYIPHWLIDPRWPGDEARTDVFISHYLYRPGGREIKLAPRDVVHFRFGLDPRNTRLGIGSLAPLMREVFTDEEAANFSAAILRNMGVPGLIVSPKDANAKITVDSAREMKEELTRHFTKDRRGEPFVATGPTDVKQFGFDPNQLMLGNLRDITEERVCAMLGVPAAVVGFGAGLQQTKVGATMRELVRLARVNCINPMAKTLGDMLTEQLVPDFQAQARRFRVRFDMSEVSVFQEDEAQWEDRILKRVQGGVLRVDQAQDLLGVEVDETQDVYLRDGRMIHVRANQSPPEPSDNGTRDGSQSANRLESITEE